MMEHINGGPMLPGRGAIGTSGTKMRRLPTVDEALQFTPITSIVPFNAGVISPPTSRAPNIPSVQLSHEQVHEAARHRNLLNLDASNASSTSAKLERTLHDLKELLSGSDLTHYKFKTHVVPAQQTNETPPPSSKPAQQHLGSFSRLLFNAVDIPYKLSSGRNARPTPAKSPASVDVKSNKTKIDPVTASNARAFQNTVRQNSTAIPASPVVPNMLPPATPTPVIVPPPVLNPSVNIPQQASSGPFIVLPSARSQDYLSQFEEYPDVDEAAAKQMNKIVLEETKPLLQEIKYVPTPDHDEKAILAYQEFQQLTSNIFEAESRIEIEGPSLEYDSEQPFISVSTESGDKWILSSRAQTQVDSVLGKVINNRRFAQVPLDVLLHLSKLCWNAVSASVEADLITPTTEDSELQDSWQKRAEVAELSLRASQILLRIMTGGREEKQLQSEESLNDVLAILRRVVEDSLVPVVESQAKAYEHLDRSNTVVLGSLLQRAGRVFKLLGQLILTNDTSETVINTTEFLAAKLVFVESNTSEKDSVLGVQKFSTLRRHAMDVLARIFRRCPSQRRYIFDEILSSLEKLPVTRQGARHYKVADAKPIQLVSALVMQLIQTSASATEDSKSKVKSDRNLKAEDSSEESDAEGEIDDSDDDASIIPNGRHTKTHNLSGDALRDLKTIVQPLYDTAQQNAKYFTGYLVHRAITTSKNDQPYRNLLDIFAEDFINVLGSADWPAAELLLRALLSNLLGIAQNDKSSAPAKVLALDLMGSMGAGIADLQSMVSRSPKILESVGTHIAKTLVTLAESSSEGALDEADVTALIGPYRAVIDFLSRKDIGDQMLTAARDFLAVQWSKSILTQAETALKREEVHSLPGSLQRIVSWLSRAMASTRVIEDEAEYGDIGTVEGRFSYAICILSLPFCKAFKNIIGILLSSLTSNHATVRSRSLKSVVELLEKDPTILDHNKNVITHILHASSDPSPLVRDSALQLVGRCLELKPALEAEVLPQLKGRASDSAVNVRKRAMKLLREIYLRNKRIEIRSQVAEAILQRADDVEESIRELARTTIEEIWLAPYYQQCSEKFLMAETQRALQDHVAHLVQTAHLHDDVTNVLITMFDYLLGSRCKNAPANNNVCRHLINIIFDKWISDSSDDDKVASPAQYLETLTIFARARPQLFNAEQMKPLQPYIHHLEKTDDLLIYRSVIVIYRCVLPLLPSLEHGFLLQVQNTMLQNIQKLGKQELEEVSTCLWIIDGVLKNTMRLVRTTMSVIDMLYKFSKQDLVNNESLVVRSKRLLIIAGYLGKVFDLEDHKDIFRQKFPVFKSGNVSSFIVDVLCEFTAYKLPESLRQFAVDAICLVSQSWPVNFSKGRVVKALQSALTADDDRMKMAGLGGIKQYFLLEEQRSKTASAIPIGMGAASGAERLSKSMLSGDREGATNTLAQQFLSHFQKIALATVDAVSLTATEVIASITRQGITHPRECCVMLVALETSPNARIAHIAYEQHKLVHSKHESILEKDNLTAVEQAFEYQRDTVKDVRGFVLDTLNPKLQLFYDVIKAGNIGTRKKLFVNLCSRIDFNAQKLPPVETLASTIDYSRFLLENLALLDYGRIDEILQVTTTLEKSFSTTGNALVQLIESTLHLSSTTKAAAPSTPPPPAAPLDPTVDPLEFLLLPTTPPPPPAPAPDIPVSTLTQLALAATHLVLMWETRCYLRRLWNLQGLSASRKPQAKDTSKAPTRTTSAAQADPAPFLARTDAAVAGVQTTDPAALRALCAAFVEFVAVDPEFNNDHPDDEDDAVAMLEGYLRGEDDDEDARSRKRKALGSTGGTPVKRKRGRPPKNSLGGGAGVRFVTPDDDADWD